MYLNYYLNIVYKVGYTLKIKFIINYETYINIQFSNYINFNFYENNTRVENLNEKNSFIKLSPYNNYYISFLNDNNFKYRIEFFKSEIQNIVYNKLWLDIINPGVYYFYTNKGFGKRGIKIKSDTFSNVLCKKIDNVENIEEIKYKEILKDTYDCIISKELVEYPVLEENSYFIFSAKFYADSYVYLYNEKEPEKKEEKSDYQKEMERKEMERKEIERKERKKSVKKWAIIFLLIFVFGTPTLFVLNKFNIFGMLYDNCSWCYPINQILFIIYLSPFSIIPCIICFIIYLVL